MERVYYTHRLGEKPSFEQVLSPATLENLVRQDLRKEAALKQAYGVEVIPAMVAAEVQRSNSSTKKKTAATLSVATLSIPKRSYEPWL